MIFLNPVNFCRKLFSLSRPPVFFVCDSYCVILTVLFGIYLAHFGGIFEILFLEQSFPSDFSWPPHVFDLSTYESYQKNSEQRRIDYFEFSSSLTSSLEEWKLNAAFWKIEKDTKNGPSFAPGMMSLVGQIPILRNHVRYLQAITHAVSGLPLPKACQNLVNGDSHRASLVILVKSTVSHFSQRQAIRQSWAANSFHRSGFSRNGFSYQVIFLLGMETGTGLSNRGEFSFKYQSDILEEQFEHGDIAQHMFVDAYFNNTAKLISGLHFIVDICPIMDARQGFVYFSDDDMLVNVRNMQKLVERMKTEHDLQAVPKDVYLGYTYNNSKPKRWRCSKWHVTTSEYPFHRYPPYVTAAAILLSKDTAEKFFYASHFLPFFRFDDIYFGILAHVLKIEAQDYRKGILYYYKEFHGNELLYRDAVIASHGYHDPKLLVDTFHKLEALYGESS